MKQQRHIDAARTIADNTYALLNFDGLPSSASCADQVAALRKDQQWQEAHHTSMSAALDALIHDIENEK